MFKTQTRFDTISFAQWSVGVEWTVCVLLDMAAVNNLNLNNLTIVDVATLHAEFFGVALNFVCDFLWTMNILFSKTLRVTKSLDIFYLSNKLIDQNILFTRINYFWKQLSWNYCSHNLYVVTNLLSLSMQRT